MAGATVLFASLPPYPAVRGSQPLPVTTPVHYQVTVFLPFGILLAEIALELLRAPSRRLFLSYAAQLGLITGFALMRLAWFVPVSGHVLLITYYLLRQAITLRAAHRARLIVGLAVALQILGYKLLVWRDPITPLTGVILGAAAWGLSLLGKREDHDRQQLRAT
jgi:hypothetical protein